jgi:hypothetical protein
VYTKPDKKNAGIKDRIIIKRLTTTTETMRKITSVSLIAECER